MNRGYLTVGGRRIHLRAGGRGPAVLLLHALPQWSQALVALAEGLSAEFAVIAPDVAGCGLSERLATPELEAVDLAEDLLTVLGHLPVNRVSIVALGNSAPVAFVLAQRLGARLGGLLLHNPWLLDPADAVALEDYYRESFDPEPSGAHLVRLWSRVRREQQFRPPHRRDAGTRLHRAMPAAPVLNEQLLGWLRAGAEGSRVLGAAARYPLVEALGRNELPVEVVSSDEDVPPPEQVRRWISGRPAAPAHSGTDVDLRDWRPAAITRRGFQREFVPVRGGYLHAQISRGGQGRPVLALHDPAGTSDLVLSFSTPLAETRPVIALDLPGNGESDNLLGTATPTSETYAGVVADALDSLGIGEVDVIGRYSGGPIGMELAFQRPGLVRHLVQAGITAYEPEEARALLERYTPSIPPRDDGGHLLTAWHIMESQALYWPWFDQRREGVIAGQPQLNARLIHQRVFDLLRCGDVYQQAYAALWTYPLRERLPRLRVPSLLCAPRWDPLFPHLGKASAAGPQCPSATLPDRFQDWHRILQPFFDGP
jgi:pimeloyl-ACP methyl ester carboxylesterase